MWLWVTSCLWNHYCVFCAASLDFIRCKLHGCNYVPPLVQTIVNSLSATLSTSHTHTVDLTRTSTLRKGAKLLKWITAPPPSVGVTSVSLWTTPPPPALVPPQLSLGRSAMTRESGVPCTTRPCNTLNYFSSATTTRTAKPRMSTLRVPEVLRPSC